LNGREIATLLPIAVVCLVLGLYPTPMLESLEPSVDALLKPTHELMHPDPPPAITAQLDHATPSIATLKLEVAQ
ncbi:MAG: hypothetical protein CMJ49_09010, partial [Planctomycetaceae bacterium]|nr:hypothetical protein [Planctomycetaceae bacterium]